MKRSNLPAALPGVRMNLRINAMPGQPAHEPDPGGMAFGVRLLQRIGDMGLPRTDQKELLDGSEWTPTELAGNFRDIERVNRYLGGVTLTVRAVSRVAESCKTSGMLSVLDVGTGSADIPVGVARWARKAHRPVAITGVDSQQAVLQLAGQRIGAYPEIRLQPATVPALAFSDASFDIAMCSLVAHHLVPYELERLLREMSRVARTAVIVNDLLRNRLSYNAARLLGGLSTHNRLTRNDGPLSIQKSYTLDELRGIMLAAGLRVVDVGQYALYRVAITAVPEMP